jgi:hypothetical protein
VRLRARRLGGPEGERLEAQATARLRDIEQRIHDFRAYPLGPGAKAPVGAVKRRQACYTPMSHQRTFI